jgi:hypothetical protein
MRITNCWNPLNSAINHDYSGIKLFCDFPQNLTDLGLLHFYRDWHWKL